jgi:hypothetical protein
LTGTAGIVNSVPLGGANGVATLDALGKVPLSQLPASVVTYLGTWNASTNTPTLTNGVGDTGDLYICNVAGTVNFGAGPITFAVGDWVIYSGTQWQKSAGSSGTVTSVGLTTTAPALTITNSPITTSGNIGINFSGNSGQYVSGDGNLVNFPTVVTQAQNLVTEVYNNSGATITKGTVVYINGGQGNLPTITKAQANTEVASNQTIGLVRADITNNNNGFVTVAGTLNDLSTNGFTVGATLYLSPSVAGAYTSTKPTSPDHIVYIGIVVRAHPTQGVIEVNIQNTQELSESSDVLITSPANNEGLFYDGTTSLWKNKTIANVLGYTPANDALVVHLAGTETITGAKTFSSVITGDAGISLKEGVVPSGVGYTGLAGDADGLVITKRVGATAYTNLLSFTTSTSNTYSFPNASGTIALISNLSSYVPYTGATGNVNLGTYSLTAAGVEANSFNAVGSGSQGGYIYLKQGSTPYAALGGSNGISAIGTKYLFIADAGSGNSKIGLFELGSLTNNTARTFTFPDASGTIALTSNITVTSITGNSPISVAAVGTAYAISIQQASSGQNGFLSSSDWTTFNNKQGAITLTTTGSSGAATFIGNTLNIPNYGSALSGYLPLTGGTLTGGLYINPTNTGVIGLDVASNNTIFRSDNLEGFKRKLQITMGSGTLVSLTANGYEANRITDLAFYTSTSGGVNSSPAIYITAGNRVGILTGSPSYDLDVNGTFRSVGNAIISGTTTFGSDIFTYVNGGLFFNGSGSYTTGIFQNSNGLNLQTGSTPRILIYNNGNVTINAPSASTRALDLNGAAGDWTSVISGNTTSGSSYGLKIKGGTTAGDRAIDIKNAADTSYLFSVSGLGNIGINSQPSSSARLLIVGASTSSSNQSLVVQNSAFTNMFVIRDDGNIGIGTSNPSRKLNISAAVNGVFEGILVENTTSNWFALYQCRTGSSGLWQWGVWTDNSYRLGISGVADFLTVTTGGNVLISTSTNTSASISATGSLQVNREIMSVGSLAGLFWENRSGGVTSSSNWYGWYTTGGVIYLYNGSSNIASINTSSGSYTALSDINKKKDFEDSTIGLDAILGLKPTLYRMQDEDEFVEKQLGFIAQEVKDYIPQAYVESGEGDDKFIGLSDRPIIAALVKAVQELSAKVSALENKS